MSARGVTSADYLAFLEKQFLPMFKRHQQRHPGRKFVFVQDGARIHTTAEVLAKLRTWGLTVFDKNGKHETGMMWPPHSPDLNPIENLWALCKRTIFADLASDLSNSKAAREALWASIKREWASFPDDMMQRLVDSFETRLALCVAKKGGPTGY
jgi:transposase